MELKDIQLPESMKRAMARQAEAEREKRAKIISAEGESLAATALGDASDIMMAHPLALQLRNLQSMVEIGVDKNTTVVFPAPLMSTIGELGSFLARETGRGLRRPHTARAEPGGRRLGPTSRPATEHPSPPPGSERYADRTEHHHESRRRHRLHRAPGDAGPARARAGPGPGAGPHRVHRAVPHRHPRRPRRLAGDADAAVRPRARGDRSGGGAGRRGDRPGGRGPGGDRVARLRLWRVPVLHRGLGDAVREPAELGLLGQRHVRRVHGRRCRVRDAGARRRLVARTRPR